MSENETRPGLPGEPEASPAELEAASAPDPEREEVADLLAAAASVELDPAVQARMRARLVSAAQAPGAAASVDPETSWWSRLWRPLLMPALAAAAILVGVFAGPRRDDTPGSLAWRGPLRPMVPVRPPSAPGPLPGLPRLLALARAGQLAVAAPTARAPRTPPRPAHRAAAARAARVLARAARG